MVQQNNEPKLSDIFGDIGGLEFLKPIESKSVAKDASIRASDLMKMKLREIRWIIDEILPAGLTILAAKPKSGKSFLALDLAISVSIGEDFLGKYPTNKTNTLYISNEDSKKRMKDRIDKMMRAKYIADVESLSNFRIDTKFPKLDGKGLLQLKRLIKKENIGLVIVDTFMKAVVYPLSSSSTQYQKDNEMTSKLQSFAMDNNIALLMVHHTRKDEPQSLTDAILGTSGIAGSADTLMRINKSNKIAQLEVEGKDVEPATIRIEFDKFIWTYKESIIDLGLTPEREEIRQLLLVANKPLKTVEIAKQLNKKKSTVSSLLTKMLKSEIIENPDFGYYAIKKIPNETGETNETSES